ncbi:MAG: CBS domain-containing protein [Treponema sp.]|nr:CBS domain-containing protein [Treponema sp.]
MSHVPISPDSGPQVVLELMYSLKVRDAMSSPVIAAGPEDSMRVVQYMMRDHGITGIPIVEERKLLGLVSIGDVIEALDRGRMGEKAGSLMTKTIISLEEDMPLAFATTYFNRYKFGRFPVLDKESRLVGIVCASDIIRRLLVAMNREVERLEAKLSDRSAATASDSLVRLDFPVGRLDFEKAGSASSAIKKALKERGIDAETVRRVAVASYELEMNQVIHSAGGRISCQAGGGRISIRAEDLGPGIADVDEAMREGYSTANEWIRSLGFGAGMGLPNAKRVADEFAISSKAGTGTVVELAILYRVAGEGSK